MKTHRLLWLALFCAVVSCLCGQVTTEPAFIAKNYKGEIKIFFNPAAGNRGMVNATKCYAHTGLITATSTNDGDWKYVKNTAWRDGNLPLTKTSDGLWTMTIAPDLHSFYGCPESEEIRRIAFVFNDGPNGSLEGKTESGADIFVDLVEGDEFNAILTANVAEIIPSGTSVTVTCTASAKASLTLTLNGQTVKSDANASSLTYTTTATAEQDYQFVFTAVSGNKTAKSSFNTCVAKTPVKASRPAGIDNGIYYNTDPTKVTLCTYAASKTAPAKHVFLVGDFNDWTISNDYQLKQDGNYFWIELSGLTPKKEYAFQYVVQRADDEIKRISDLYSEKVLHSDDRWEPKEVDPDLMDYPAKGDGYVSVLQTDKTPFAWSDATLNFKRPDKNNLIIYELWVYDHTARRSIAGLLGRLDYLEALGVNAIELMPVTEFDGNLNWGYSPNHYFALDKAYGTPEELKTFIDECHKRGIAVILDMVFNHATGNNPMNKLYPWGADLVNNPWFNVTAPHPDNVYEDWNHDFGPAHNMFIRAMNYWLQEYKVDGYRLDLSHGLCGPKYNAVNNLKDYYEKGVKAVSPDAYFILEHWGSSMDTDRPQLVNAGMLCWENTSHQYMQTAGAWLKDDNLSNANKDGYVSYCTSHDEERPFFKAKQWGDGDLQTNEEARCARVPLNMAFLTMLNGPKMFYHFEELGFDYSKFQNQHGVWGQDGYKEYGASTVKSYDKEDYKMVAKYRPDTHHWFDAGPRMRAYQKTAQIIQLRTRLLPKVFEGNPTAANIGTGLKLRTIQWGSDVYVVGNFSPVDKQTATLPAGTWYDYLAGGNKADATYTLEPGEVKVFTGKQLTPPAVPASFDSFSGWNEVGVTGNRFEVYPTVTDGMLYISGNPDVAVYNLNGQCLLTAPQAEQLNVSLLPVGLYILRLSRDGLTETVRVIKD